MKSLKTIIVGSTLACGLLLGTSVLADSLYTVKSGDTLSAISKEFVGSNKLVEQIAKDNDISDINLIFPGQELKIKFDNDKKVTPVTTQKAEEVKPDVKEEGTIVDNTQEEDIISDEADEINVGESDNNHTEYTGESSSAKEWIAQRESGGDYNATNGYHIGRYQLDPSYLNGDHSPENQEKVADEYVSGRYGSWEKAQEFWMNNGWY